MKLPEKLQICSDKNLIAETWLNEYYKTKKYIKTITKNRVFGNHEFSEFEEMCSYIFDLEEAIEPLTGLPDYFKDYVEAQTGEFAGYFNLFLKHDVIGENGEMSDVVHHFMNELLKALRANEKKISQ